MPKFSDLGLIYDRVDDNCDVRDLLTFALSYPNDADVIILTKSFRKAVLNLDDQKPSLCCNKI